MIVTCPSCTQRYRLNPALLPADQVLHCQNCSHSWLEPTLVQAQLPAMHSLPVTPPAAPAIIEHEAQLPAVIDPKEQEIADEISALTAESREAATRLLRKKQQTRRQRIKWAALAASVVLPLTAAAALPNVVAYYAPGTAPLYRSAGYQLNTRGFEIENIAHQKLVVDNVPVLAIRGNVRSISYFKRRAPALRFILKDESGKPLHAWTLSGVKSKPMQPGEESSFVTRLASPPPDAKEIEIRFAHRDEIG